MPATRRHILVLTAGFVLLVFAPISRAQDNLYRPDVSAAYLDSSLKTDWYGVYLQNKKIGYGRHERKREKGTIIDEQLMSFKLVSMGVKVELGARHAFVFQDKAPYRMTRAVAVESAGGMETKTTFTLTPEGDYESVHEVAGQKRTERIRGIDYTLADASASEIWVRQNPKVGDTIRARSFELTDAKMDVETSKVLSSKESLVGGVPVRFFEVETKGMLRPLTCINRFDDQGNVLSTVVAVFELRRETEEQAKNIEYSQDLMVLGTVKIDQAIGRTDDLRELVVEVDGKGGAVFEDGPRQSVQKAEGGKHLLRLGKRYGKEQKATAAEIKEALAETNRYPISQPKIKKLAEQVTSGAKTEADKVAKIVAFVHDYVTPNPFAAHDPNIHDLLKQKKGDCKSYALLFNNLARAAGVPAREVAGLLYIGDDGKGFGGHAWNEVVLDGVWVPIDASRGETEIDAGHVCFGADHKGESNMMSSLGKLSFRLVEVKKAP